MELYFHALTTQKPAFVDAYAGSRFHFLCRSYIIQILVVHFNFLLFNDEYIGYCSFLSTFFSVLFGFWFSI